MAFNLQEYLKELLRCGLFLKDFSLVSYGAVKLGLFNPFCLEVQKYLLIKTRYGPAC